MARPVCPDGGTCHHRCPDGSLRSCFRVSSCAPLSGVYPGDRWPEVEPEAPKPPVAWTTLTAPSERPDEERLDVSPRTRFVAEHFLTWLLTLHGFDHDIAGVEVMNRVPPGRFAVVREDPVIVALNPATLTDMNRAYAELRSLGYELTIIRLDDDPPAAPKEAAVAADIEKKIFVRKRVEYWIPTGRFDGDGGRFEDTGLAYAWAQQELENRGVIKPGASAEGHIRIKPSDEHVIVFVEFDEEQK